VAVNGPNGSQTINTALDVTIAGVVVEFPNSIVVLPDPAAALGVSIQLLNLSAQPFAFTEAGGGISDVVGVCGPPPAVACRDGSFQGIFFISDPLESPGTFNTTIPETGEDQNITSLVLSSDAINAGFTATFASDVEVTTPIPAALPLFATGIGALGLLGWRRKRKARAAI
jgi:hypothetical protein